MKIFSSDLLSQADARLTINGNTASWTPSKGDRKTILQSGGGTFTFVVRAADTHLEFGTGGGARYVTTGPYWSNQSQKFTITP